MTGQQIGCIAYFDAAQLSGENAVSMIYRSAHVLRATLTPPLRRSLTTHYPTDDTFPAA